MVEVRRRWATELFRSRRSPCGRVIGGVPPAHRRQCANDARVLAHTGARSAGSMTPLQEQWGAEGDEAIELSELPVRHEDVDPGIEAEATAHQMANPDALPISVRAPAVPARASGPALRRVAGSPAALT